MVADARISAGLPGHPKTKKLIKRLGQAGAWNLVRLILWAATDRSDGDLSGMSTEDIELAADWQGDDGHFVAALVDVRFLDGEEGAYMLHDWQEHNPWAAGAEARSAKARWNAAKRHHGVAEADRLVPEYASHRNATSNASSMDLVNDSIAPSPSPSPSPSLIPNTPPPPEGGRRRVKADPDAEPAGFSEWYGFYPRKDAKRDAIKAWRDLSPDTSLQLVMQAAARNWPKNPDPTKIPLPATWLRGARWNDACVARFATQAVLADAAWWIAAGFPNMFEAENNRCWAHNSHLFRDGKRLEVAA